MKGMIGLKTPGGIKAITVRKDGYPENVGWILSHFYGDTSKLDALLECGPIEELGKTVFEVESRMKGYSSITLLDYTHGEKREKMNFSDEEDFVFTAPKMNARYLYLYDDGTWKYYDFYDLKQKNMVPLSEVGGIV